jgi:hypothetical protein
MKKILIVDEPPVQSVIQRILEHEGYEVLAVTNISTAKRLLLSGPVDLVLSDINLPDGSGLALCRWTLSQRALQATKVVLCSGHFGFAQESTPEDPECLPDTKSIDSDSTMKSDGPPSEPDSSPPPYLEGPPGTQLEFLLEFAHQEAQEAQEAMLADGRLLPTLFTVSPDGLCFFDAPPTDNDADAGQFASRARLICAAQAARVMVVAVEIWVAKTRPRACPPLGMSPSSSLPGGEYVVLAGEAIGGFFAQWFAPILRNKSGQSGRLGDVLVLTSKPCGGLMAGVLPESPPTPEVRDFARSVLKASGVRLIRAATSAGPDTGQDSNPPN